MALESEVQAAVIAHLKARLPGVIILKNDSALLQGIPDLLVLWRRCWGMLEVKRSAKEPYQPNQEYYLRVLNEMSWAATIYPENMMEVLDALEQAFRASR